MSTTRRASSSHATARPSRNPCTVETTLPSARHPSSVTSLVLAHCTAASSSDAPTGVICRVVSSSRCSIKSSRVFQQRLGASCRRGSALGDVASTPVPPRTIINTCKSNLALRVRRCPCFHAQTYAMRKVVRDARHDEMYYNTPSPPSPIPEDMISPSPTLSPTSTDTRFSPPTFLSSFAPNSSLYHPCTLK